MRLYLSSFRLGTEPEYLVRLAGRGGRFAVIANAVDTDADDVRREKVDGEVRALASLGLLGTEFDLREHFGSTAAETMSGLSMFDGLWVRGGNVFALRSALAVSAADVAIVDLLARDALVYAGYSAGPCVLGPTLAGLETVDDADAPRRLGLGEPLMDGLGVLQQRVVPHVASSTHPESVALDRLSEEYSRDGISHLALADGQALVVDGPASRVVGRPATVEELIAAYPM
jgi:dipeptidase E